jgi:hypothetical protein
LCHFLLGRNQVQVTTWQHETYQPLEKQGCEERFMIDRKRITELEAQIAALKARLPKHSVPPAMIIELEELEEELETLKARVNREPD